MIFKCKICGATLDIKENEKKIVCEYCGSTQLIKIKSDDIDSKKEYHKEYSSQFNQTNGSYIQTNVVSSKLILVSFSVIAVLIIAAVTILCLVMLRPNSSTMKSMTYTENNTVSPNSHQKTEQPKAYTNEYIDEPEDYLFPSDRQYITYSDVSGKSEYEVSLIRNEIYARHGYIFQTEPYISYFNQKDWYQPNSNFDTSLFNSIEKANVDFIIQYEKEMGWRE